MISVARPALGERRLRAAARVGMVREAADREPARAGAAAHPRGRALERRAAAVDAQQLADERRRRDRAARQRARQAADRRRLAEQDLVAPVPRGPQRPQAGGGQLPVAHRGGGVRDAAAARELRVQPARQVRLVAERPAGHARQHASALVLVPVGPGVAPAERPHEVAVEPRGGPAHAQPGGRQRAAAGSGGPARDRRGGGEEHGEPARARAADEVVEPVPLRGGVCRRVGAAEAARAARRRRARSDRPPGDLRAEPVRAQDDGVVERGVARRGAALEQLRLILQQRDLAARGLRAGGREQAGGEDRDKEAEAHVCRRERRRAPGVAPSVRRLRAQPPAASKRSATLDQSTTFHQASM